ncbi:flagellar basal body L-ring protein FlgH [Planktomarina temperata]|jgi:flagellar L-ring protein precursor FlgH|uniref:flagellar basal body L-ring protein FlgH n=1 Tax=uncultured Planktomarina sp. TaxID=1538529 RepID=UPI000D560217|nr:flagellar basal body L-ring protein FlgH [Tateyamaria sp.]MDA7474381.1 flagellar basal body L-ring protein FlgH [Planktomarina temperata]MDA9110200.1 flagellar basal body L-ring protein FlgH [bacterium]MDA8722432.1 flagellar basal body L-ring protein FlgH [Planktomarina temperata]MDA9267931.1 flagellar basal body L-ring protein FlgH [bacterium]|tara:strand:- start:837 stop:1493 length:657 start_codon:yes stop_codon:yes gene_type:complete
MHKIVPVLVIMLSGCAQHNADRVSIDFEPMYPQEMPLVETNNRSGTIFNATRGNLFSMESRAQMVGDIITVQFAESFQATKSQNAATAKSNDSSISLPTALGTPELSTKLGSSLANTFSGSGSSAQSNSLNGQVSVHVVRVFQNGNLEILGQKKLTLNNGDEYIRVHGIVRPKDINEKNIVSSDRIANANIQYIGAGDIAASGKKGWYSKILDTINPL